jgi:hypothetical protein
VHGEISAAVEHGVLYLTYENTLTADRVERDVGAHVALGADEHQLDVDVGVGGPQRSAT